MWGLRRSALRLGHVINLPIQTSSSSSRCLTMVSTTTWTRREKPTTSCIYLQQIRYFARPSMGKANKALVNNFKVKEIIKNEEISKNYSELRVVYKNDSTGRDEHKIMSRLEALNLSKSMSLDLILVSESSTPPVCRIDDSGSIWCNVTSINTHFQQFRLLNSRFISFPPVLHGCGIMLYSL